MNIVAALILFDVLVIIYQILIEVFTILYRINGINVEISKLQVISLLTGTGFTTSESEGIIVTKKRRKITQRIMFFSYIFNVSIVSTFVTIFASTATATKEEIPICIGLTLFVILFTALFYKTKIARKIIDKIVMTIINHKKIKKENFMIIYDTYGNKVIAEIELKILSEKMKNKTIEEMGLKEKHRIQLLVLKRKGQVISEIYPDTTIQEGDVVVVFGKMRDIKNAFIKEIEEKVNAEINV